MSCIDASVRIVTKSPKVGPLLIFSISLVCINVLSVRDGDKMATSMEKKIAELEMGLLHLQQNIDIPGAVTGTLIPPSSNIPAAMHTRPQVLVAINIQYRYL
jgi:hypothetical protein